VKIVLSGQKLLRVFKCEGDLQNIREWQIKEGNSDKDYVIYVTIRFYISVIFLGTFLPSGRIFYPLKPVAVFKKKTATDRIPEGGSSSVAVLVKFWTQEMFSKFCRNQKLSAIFRFLPEQFPYPEKISWVITYTMLSNNFIFVKILKLQFLPLFFKIVATFWKDSIFRADIFAKILLKYWRNFWCRNTRYSSLFRNVILLLFFNWSILWYKFTTNWKLQNIWKKHCLNYALRKTSTLEEINRKACKVERILHIVVQIVQIAICTEH